MDKKTDKSSYFPLAFIISLMIFILIGNPWIEDFFSRMQWLFYLLFFGPLVSVLLSFGIFVISKYLGVEYYFMKKKGIPRYRIYLYLLCLLILIIFFIIARFERSATLYH